MIGNEVHRTIATLHHSTNDQTRTVSRHLPVTLQSVRAHNVEKSGFIF